MFFQVNNASQIYLSPLGLKSSIFQHSEARRFTVTKGIRRLQISFADVTPTSVFIILISRKCEGGDFRAVFEAGGVQRFDEFVTESSRIIRVLSHSGENGTLTFMDSEKCKYEIKIEQDWKNTLKLAVLEWAAIVPFLMVLHVCLLTFAASMFAFNSLPFLCITFLAFGLGSLVS